MNKVIFVGRITKDIELRYTQDQKAVAHFTLAVDRRKKGEADFISCVAWNRTAELLNQYCGKGSKIGIVGRIETGSYTARSGEKRFTTDVMVEEMEFIESKKASDQKADSDGFVSAPESVEDEGLPF